jgi:hypothetical protein
MDLRKRAKTLRARVEAQMSQLVTVQQNLSDRAAMDPTVRTVNETQAWPPPPPPLYSAGQQQFPPRGHPHGLAQRAAAMRHQLPIIHKLAAPTLTRTQGPASCLKD